MDMFTVDIKLFSFSSLVTVADPISVPFMRRLYSHVPMGRAVGGLTLSQPEREIAMKSKSMADFFIYLLLMNFMGELLNYSTWPKKIK